MAAERPLAPLVQIAAGDRLADGIEQAFDYRGDGTVTLGNGESLEGNLFDRDPAISTIRLLTKNGERTTVKYGEVVRLTFTGPDMADGRSGEAWIRRYSEGKAAGEKNIELVPEAID